MRTPSNLPLASKLNATRALPTSAQAWQPSRKKYRTMACCPPEFLSRITGRLRVVRSPGHEEILGYWRRAADTPVRREHIVRQKFGVIDVDRATASR